MSRDAIAERRSPDGEVHVWKARIDGRAAARLLRDEILASYLGESGPLALATEEGGKPRLAASPERLAFNLSHSGELALIAVVAGGIEVGVDVERVKPRRDPSRLATRWLPPADAEAVSAAPGGPERERAFYAAWTRHEARVKCTGAGLAGPPPGPEVIAYDLAIDDGYAAAVAVAGLPLGTEPRIVLRDASCRR